MREVYEIHVTVAEGREDHERFRGLCEGLDAKDLLIQMPYGKHQLQMMTNSDYVGSIEGAFAEMEGISRALIKGGFEISRQKIETLVTSKHAPQTDEEAVGTSGKYFEYHVDIPINSAYESKKLEEITIRHGAHLSRNLKKNVARAEEIATIRHYELGRMSSWGILKAFTNDLKLNSISIKSIMPEYCIYDSNPSLDSGWVEK